jgi:hypothetical protein
VIISNIISNECLIRFNQTYERFIVVLRFFCYFLIIFIGYHPLLFSKNHWKAVKGQIVTQGAILYEEPHFDSEPLVFLKKGTQVRVINKRLNLAFFKVQLPTKKKGYVVDLDVEFKGKKPPPRGPLFEKGQDSLDGENSDPFLDESQFQLGSSSPSDSNSNSNSHSDSDSDSSSSSDSDFDSDSFFSRTGGIPYEDEKLFGFRYYFMSYSEKTMGRHRRDDLSAWGFSWRGPDWVDFVSYVDTGFLFSSQPPSYYEKVLGFRPEGFVAWGYFNFMTSSALSERLQVVYGFGPFFRGSSWELQAQHSERVKTYQAIDVKIGGLASWGLAYRFKHVALRLDLQFWFEQVQYTSLGLGLEFP